MPIPSGDSTGGEAGPDHIHAVALLSRAPVPARLLPISSCPPARARDCVPAVSLAPPAGHKGHSQAATTTAGAATATGTTAQGEGYGN